VVGRHDRRLHLLLAEGNASDCFAICSTTKKPVLSHLFLNYLLDNGVAYSNFVNFNGYQPPLNEIDPSSLVKDGVVPENLENSVLTNADL
jgi:spermidine/putrescine transport system substrate-binding protein